MMDRMRANFLRNKSNEGMIEFLKHMTILEKMPNTS
jgi:hypothetical protein